MPRKPKRGCAYPGCPRLTDGQYCEEHKKLVESQYNRYERSPNVHKVYGRAWGFVTAMLRSLPHWRVRTYRL